MQFDLLASIEMTVCAAIAISTLSIGFGENGLARVRIAGWLSAWFALVTIMASTGLLTYPHGLGTPGLGVAVAAPIIGLVATVLISPSLRQRLQSIPLPTLIGVNAIRILGVTFLILYGVGRLPFPFAPVAGWGDILAGVTAVPVAWFAYKLETSARPVVWIWNTFGLLDLVAAIGLGVISAPGPTQLIFAEPGTTIMTTLPWLIIPAFLVPLLASTHLAVFYRLINRQRR